MAFCLLKYLCDCINEQWKTLNFFFAFHPYESIIEIWAKASFTSLPIQLTTPVCSTVQKFFIRIVYLLFQRAFLSVKGNNKVSGKFDFSHFFFRDGELLPM